MTLEIIRRAPTIAARPTPLLFVHGAWHGAWCWDETFLPYFADNGYESLAVSLRGHGRSASDKPLRWVPVADYVADVAQAAAGLSRPPVVIGHSMGGYVLQKYLEKHAAPAAVLLASVPTHGILPFLLRMMRRQPLNTLHSLLTMTPYHLIGSAARSKAAFFSPDLPDEQARLYHSRLQDESYLTSLQAMGFNLPRPRRVKTPLLVIGAVGDRVFSVWEVEATARAYRTQAVILPNLAHDIMLEPRWQTAADHILAWLRDRDL